MNELTQALETVRKMEAELWDMVGSLRKKEVDENPSVANMLVDLLIEVSSLGDALEQKGARLCTN